MQSGIPTSEQSISLDGRDLSDPTATMAGLGVGQDALLLIRRKVNIAGRCVYNYCMIVIMFSSFIKYHREAEQDTEMMRLTILGDPVLMNQLREVRLEA